MVWYQGKGVGVVITNTDVTVVRYDIGFFLDAKFTRLFKGLHLLKDVQTDQTDQKKYA